MEEDFEISYLIRLSVIYNELAPLKLVMECDKELKNEMGESNDYQRISKDDFNVSGTSLHIWKNMASISKFSIDWSHKRMKQILEKHKDVIVHFSFEPSLVKRSETLMDGLEIKYDVQPRKNQF